jgi:hypothetical protein
MPIDAQPETGQRMLNMVRHLIDGRHDYTSPFEF